MSHRIKPVLLALGASVLAFLAAAGIELLTTRLFHAEPRDVVWVSDVILAAALLVASFLWLDLRSTQIRLTDLERSQVALDAELRLAAEIQRGFLPPVPPSLGGCRFAARIETAGRVGGDFYDFVRPDAGSLLCILGDISGKGIPAALFLAGTRVLFRTIARETRDPSELVARLSQAVFDDNQGAAYLTCMLLRLDFDGCRLTYVNAGHPPGLLFGTDGTRSLDVGGLPAGLLPSSAYRSEEVVLRRGDLGVLMTDGITEALEGDERPLVDVIGSAVRIGERTVSPEGACRALMDLTVVGGPPDVEGWTDDRTVLAFAFDGAG
jgi:phosphoserine phosphatase RsbU/P